MDESFLITDGAWEAFERILKQRGHFKQGLAKAAAAASIGERFDPQHNNSHSFKVFRDAIVEAAM